MTNIPTTEYLSVSEYLALSDDERYAEVRRVTITDTSEEAFEKYHRDSGKRWLDLARFWDKIHTCKKHFVLTSAIHKIFWGVTPYDSCDPDFVYLLSLVEAEVLDNGEAYQSWSKWIVFKRILNGTLDSMTSFGASNIDIHSIEHYHYLRSRARCKIEYDKTKPDDYHEYLYEYRSYENIVRLLVPEAANWNRQQWGDDCNILDALEARYGIDYGESYERQRDYERTVLMLRAKDRYKDNDNVAFLWYASNIAELPLSMALVIWPENLFSIAADLLWKAYDLTVAYEDAGQPFSDRKGCVHPVPHFERSQLKNSWLNRQVSKWLNEGRYSGPRANKLKSIIFDLQVTC